MSGPETGRLFFLKGGYMEILTFLTIKQACILRKALIIFLFLIEKCGVMFADETPIKRGEVAELLKQIDDTIIEYYKTKSGV